MNKTSENVFLGIISILIQLFNLLSGVISIIWLLSIGEGKLIFVGLIISIVMPFVYSILSLPTYLLMPIMVKQIERRKKRGLFIAFFSGLYEKGLIYLWLIYVFGIFQIGNLNGHSIIPFVLWGYTIALGPLSYMAQKEGENIGIGTTSALFATCLSYILMTIFWYFKLSNEILYGIPLAIYVLVAIIPPLSFLPILKANNENDIYNDFEKTY